MKYDDLGLAIDLVLGCKCGELALSLRAMEQAVKKPIKKGEENCKNHSVIEENF